MVKCENPGQYCCTRLIRDSNNMARVGIWKCPECQLHQTWKTRSDKSNKLDRKCTGCGKRVRTTLDRSVSGKGRVRNVEIWERSSKDWGSLEEEVQRRNRGSFADPIASVSGNENEELQSNIPKILSSEIENFTNIAFKMLDGLQISEEKKDFLRDFGNSLMKRNI